MLAPDTSKLSFAVCVSFYNDCRGMSRLLDSVAGNVEFVFCLDGRYDYVSYSDDPYFEKPLSTDGSREVVSWFKDKNVVLIDAPDMGESRKREKYIELARQYQVDNIITLDSDEYIWLANWEKFRAQSYQKIIARDKSGWNIYNVSFRDNYSFSLKPRLWHKPWELAYGLTHYEFYKKSDETRKLITMGGDEYHYVDHLLIRHDRSLRTVDHILARERWEFAQQQVEDKVMWGPDWEGLKTVKHARPPRQK